MVHYSGNSPGQGVWRVWLWQAVVHGFLSPYIDLRYPILEIFGGYLNITAGASGRKRLFSSGLLGLGKMWDPWRGLQCSWGWDRISYTGTTLWAYGT